MGQKDAIHQMVNAFRRPYLMGEEAGKAKNVILVSGPVGSGRHEAVTQMARSLYERQVFISENRIDVKLKDGITEKLYIEITCEADVKKVLNVWVYYAV